MKTTPWDVTEFLKTDRQRLEYLRAAVVEGDERLILMAVRDILRSMEE